jgi:NitT/TauT family transport system substrate-binding protein
MNFRSLTAGTVAAALAALALVATPTRAQAPTPIRAAYIPAVTSLPDAVAKEKGSSQSTASTWTLTVAQNLSVLPGTAGRKFEFVPSTAPDLLKAIASGLDVVTVAASIFETADHVSTQLMVAKDSIIASTKDLSGKLIATPTIGSVIHVSVLYWLEKNGIDPGSIGAVEVPFPNMADQLNARRVDAVEVVEPFVGALKAGGNVALTAPLLSAGREVLFPFWIASGEWARAHGPTVAVWKASLDDAIIFIKENPGEARVFRPSSILPIHTFAFGLICAAYLQADVVTRTLKSEMPKSGLKSRKLSVAKQAALFEEIRRGGFSVVQGDLIQCLDAIAEPVLDHRGDLVACVAAVGSSGGLDISASGRVVCELKASAKRFAQLIG